jgi:hypothetical protein
MFKFRRGAWVRFYPTFLFLIGIAQRALALEPASDPVLSVQAPELAQEVTAYFPFAPSKRLAWDAFRQRWSVRVVVPRDVADGRYPVRVRVVHDDGDVEWEVLEYTVDARAPELEVSSDELALPGEAFHVRVDPQEPVREVLAYIAHGKYKRQPVSLKLDTESGLYTGELIIPVDLQRDELTIRIVARDLARNRVEQALLVPLLAAPDCCEDAYETCRL